MWGSLLLPSVWTCFTNTCITSDGKHSPRNVSCTISDVVVPWPLLSFLKYNIEADEEFHLSRVVELMNLAARLNTEIHHGSVVVLKPL